MMVIYCPCAGQYSIHVQYTIYTAFNPYIPHCFHGRFDDGFDWPEQVGLVYRLLPVRCGIMSRNGLCHGMDLIRETPWTYAEN